MLTKEFLAPFLTFLGEHDRFGLAYRIEDHSLFVQPTECIPVMSFPCASVVMNCQEEEREDHLVDFVFVVFHGIMLPFRSQDFNRPGKEDAEQIAAGNRRCGFSFRRRRRFAAPRLRRGITSRACA